MNMRERQGDILNFLPEAFHNALAYAAREFVARGFKQITFNVSGGSWEWKEYEHMSYREPVKTIPPHLL